jgi:nicotinamide mononucleotide transporter
LKWIPVYLGVTGLAYLGVLVITNTLGATMAVTDSMILIGSILAQFLLDNKKMENWYVWMVVNGFAIYTYFAAGLMVAGFQYIFFFANCFYGVYVWSKSRRAQSIRIDDRFAPHIGALEFDSVRPVTS